MTRLVPEVGEVGDSALGEIIRLLGAFVLQIKGILGETFSFGLGFFLVLIGWLSLKLLSTFDLLQVLVLLTEEVFDEVLGLELCMLIFMLLEFLCSLLLEV